MVGNYKLAVDINSDLSSHAHKLLEPWADLKFQNFQEHVNSGKLISGAVYVIGRHEFTENVSLIKELAKNKTIHVIFSNAAEGADAMFWLCKMLGIYDLVKQGKILIITGGDLPPDMPHLYYENFLTKILSYNENLEAIEQYKQHNTTVRPYKFLFLNGRARAHRKYLLEKFKVSGLLNESLWTNLDTRTLGGFRYLDWYNHCDESLPQWPPNQDFAYTPFTIKFLPQEYEVYKYQKQFTIDPPESDLDLPVKRHLFNNEWGDIYLSSKPYIDTYFSLVTETTFDYPYSFRTEKIWKPIAIGHPWIAVANSGYYRDMHNLGFKTFGHLIDESFDSIEDPLNRCSRISKVVEDLCKQDLAKFVSECYNICKYNQLHLAELNTKVQQEFPERFFQFIKQQYFNE